MNDSLIGVTIGGYQILAEIGRGGMATVYRAHQISMDRDVAIKVLPPQFIHQAASLERFKQEASIVARLEHRAIVPVHDYGEYEGIPYIVMRYMDSGSVDELLTKGAISPEQTLLILQQIAPALDYAHREGVLHRDLKPSNILLDANGDAYVTDFGIARILGTNPKPLTTSGVVGTPSYMSPEQAQGHELDGRSDVYALGVVLFEMLTGVRPFEGETPYSVAVKHVTEPPPSACAINPKLPHAIEAVLFKALAKKCEMRHQTAGELAAALKTAFEKPADPVMETEPSLNEALNMWRKPESIPAPPNPSPPVAQAVNIRQQSPNPPMVPVYMPSHSYTSVLVPARRRKASRMPSWLTWATLALLIGGLILAVALAGIYYAVNGDNSPVGTRTENYNATAIFKLTATKEAILQLNATDDPSITATIPPTNTPRVSQNGPPLTSNE